MSKKTLTAITYGSVIIFFVLLMVLIFAVAGNWAFMAGWLFMVAFCVPTLIITAYFLKKDPKLIERRVMPTETRPVQMIGQSIAGMLFFALIALSALDHRFGFSTVPMAVSALADILIMLGFYIVFRVFEVNSFASRAIETMKEQKVITEGPYSVIRHPMYAGAAMIILSIPIALGSWVTELIVLPLIAVIVFRILDEEKMLRAELPGYEAYCKKTKFRFIPHVW
ncbi:MAG: isoprenylcysteine carboxylmethyltransferase family protein [Clostridia bacterium]|nr:isoprenylcysteine carboxylmethyltransferase family protein [Clostridia bacterium]